ncbi:MAG: Ig-like domain-containing protein, partial [Actinomycetota bacterium]
MKARARVLVFAAVALVGALGGPRAGYAAVEQAKLTALDAAGLDRFGNATAIAGDSAIVGSRFDDGVGSDSGSAYVFFRTGSTWTQQAKLTASDAAAFDRFGASVALAGDTAIVGSVDDADAGPESGSAYAFVRSGSTWTQQAKLVASDAAALDNFGSSVAVAGGTAIVGSNGDDDAGSASGSAYVFVRSGSTWTQQAKLTASDAAAFDRFGISVSVTGDTAVVGSPFEDNDAGSSSGSAYVFVRSGSTWTQQAKLVASDAAEFDQFGISVSVAGDTAVIGSGQDDDAGSASGSAYVFVRTGSTWTQQAKLVASDAAEFDQFGISVSVAGDTVVVGSPFDDDAGPDSGSAYVFFDAQPSAVDDAFTTPEDTPLTEGAPGLLANDVDPDDALSASLVAGPSNGSATVNADGSFTYTPAANFNGSDSFTYRACDSWLRCADATATIVIDPVNDPPSAVDDAYETAEDTPLVVPDPGVLGNDVDVDGTLTASVVTAPASGTLALGTDGSFTYTPAANVNGTVTFTYRATDPSGASDTATVT